MIGIANFLGGFTTLFLGLIIRFLKASSLIAGYNTASKEEKAKYDEEKLTEFVGNMLIVSSIILLLGGFLTIIISTPLCVVFISWALFLLIIIGGVIYMNTGNRFKK
jgi:membrane protein YqaA with SNARE-associated domain